MKKIIKENEDIKRAVLLMGYDPGKTLKENVKEIIGEQSIDDIAPAKKEEPKPNTPQEKPANSNIVTDADLIGNTNVLRSFIQTLSDFNSGFGGPIGMSLGLPNLFDALGLNAANLMGGRRAGVKGVVDALDGWVSAEDLAYVLTVIKSLENKCYIDDVQEPPVKVPAMKRFLELYSEDENGDSLTQDIYSVGTRTLPAGTEKLKQKAIYLISKYSNAPCSNEQKAPEGTGGNKGNKQQYGPCTNYPFTIGCINEVIKKVQGCLGLKTDGMFGPKTLAAIKTKLPNFDGKLTNDIFNTLMRSCGEQTPSTEVTKMKPRTTNVTSPQVGQNVNPELKTRPTTSGLTPTGAFTKGVNIGAINKTRNGYKVNNKKLDPKTKNLVDNYLRSKGYTFDKNKNIFGRDVDVWTK